MSDAISLYGLTPVEAKIPDHFPDRKPEPMGVHELGLPTSTLATCVHKYAKEHLPPQTYNHSMRVYSYGLVFARTYYTQWDFTPGSALEETWFLTAILHDIGTCPEFIDKTYLSFEFWGGFHVLGLLQGDSPTSSGAGLAGARAPRPQAESVAEAIIRHQDIQDHGFVTLMTRLIHQGTLLDNLGLGMQLIHHDAITSINDEYKRTGWSSCFADTVLLEKKLKPWTMVSRIEGFEDKIRENGSGWMSQYEA